MGGPHEFSVGVDTDTCVQYRQHKRANLRAAEMDLGSRLEALLGLAEDIGIDVRTEPMGGEGGGMCRLRGRRVLFVDTSADVATRYDRTVAAMADVAELDDRYVVPEVREDIDRQREAASGEVGL